jgi:hypothetical protein
MTARILGRFFIVGAFGTRGNPTGNEGHLLAREGQPLGRHAAVVLSGFDAADEFARPRVARYENEPVVAPFAGELSRVEAKVPRSSTDDSVLKTSRYVNSGCNSNEKCKPNFSRMLCHQVMGCVEKDNSNRISIAETNIYS